MARRQKISQMNPKGANLQATDLLEVSVLTGTGYDTYSITGQQIINAGGGGGSQDLQQVTDIGSITTNSITITSGVNEATTVSGIDIKTENTLANTYVTLRDTGEIALKTGGEESSLQNTNVSNPGIILEFPDKATGSYTIATEDDLTSGYVPYTGATADVDLGNNDLNAEGIKIKGTAGNGHLNLKHQSSDATAGGSESVIYADASGNPKWKNDGNAVQAVMLENSAITGATKTKITYDSKGLVIAGADATTADIADSTNKRYVTDAQLTVIGNTSGTNTGDETQSSILSKLGVFYLPFTPSSIVTGTTSETQVAVVTIPANSIKSVDNLKIYTPVVKTGTTGLCTVTYKLSTSPTMPSGTTDRIAFVAGTTSSLWIGMNRNPSYNSGNLIIAQTTTSLISDLTTAAQAPSVVAKDNSVTLYLYVSITLGNSNDSAYLSGGYITNN